MVTISRSFQVNVPGEPTLSQAEVWRGLELKPRNALPFVTRMQQCEVVEEFDGGLVRDITIRDEHHRERITFHPQRQVRFDRIAGPTTGYILNEIDRDERGELWLRFTFQLERKDMAPGSSEECAYFAGIEDSYADAVRTTLQTIRRLKTTQEDGGPAVDNTLSQLMTRNLSEVFGERDSVRRQAVIRELYAEDCAFFDEEEQSTGRNALNARAGHILEEHPGFVFRAVGRPQVNHDLGRLQWQFGPPGSAPVVTGMDVAVFQVGRIRALYTFLDKPSEDQS